MQFVVTSDSAWPDVTVNYTFDAPATPNTATLIVSMRALANAMAPVQPTLANAVTYLSSIGYAHQAGLTPAPVPPAGVTANLNVVVTAQSAAAVAAQLAALGL